MSAIPSKSIRTLYETTQAALEKATARGLPAFLLSAAASGVLGLVWYLILYGRYPLYVTHVSWLYNAGGDALQHQLGWEWFRKAAWQFPLGSIQALGYPVGTSVTYMDSIPLLAIPFKLLSPWLEPTFQYFGLWELASLVLMILTGTLVMREFTRSLPLALLASSLLALSSPQIFRAFYHSSLSAHWIVLAGIWFVLLERRKRLWRWAWVALFGVAMLVHLYFIPMLLPLWIISLYYQYRSAPRRWRLALDVLTVAGVVLLTGNSTGAFGLGYKDLAISGYGTYSWNLNGFLNPLDIASAFARGMAITGGQYEGISYLGIGNLLLLPVAVYLFALKENPRRRLAVLLPFLAAAGVYTLFAVSNKAFFSLQPVWDFALPDAVQRFVNLFRSSGRFIWPVYYFIVLFVLVMIARNVRYPGVVIGFALLLQLLDLQPLYGSKAMQEFAVYQTPMQSAFWEVAADSNRHVVVLPATKVREFGSDALAIWAVQQDLTLNYAYFARSDRVAIREAARAAWEDLLAEQPDPHTLYVFSDPEYIRAARDTLAETMIVCEVDGYTVALAVENGLIGSGFNMGQVCSIP